MRDLYLNLLTRYLNPTWLIWTLSGWVVCSQTKSLTFWPDMVDLGRLVCAWFLLESISLKFWPRHVWLGLTACVYSALKSSRSISDSSHYRFGLSLCVVCSHIYSLDIWLRRGLFLLSGCEWFALVSTNSVSDPNTVDLDSRWVSDLLLYITRYMTWLICTLSLWVVSSCIHSLNFWLGCRFGLSVCAWFPLWSSPWMSQHDLHG